jgi:hypothetical protein
MALTTCKHESDDGEECLVMFDNRANGKWMCCPVCAMMAQANTQAVKIALLEKEIEGLKTVTALTGTTIDAIAFGV